MGERWVARPRGAAPHGDGGTIKQPNSSAKIDFTLTTEQFAEGTAPNPLWDIYGKRPVGDPPFIRRPVDDVDRRFFGRSTFHDSFNAGLEKHQ